MLAGLALIFVIGTIVVGHLFAQGEKKIFIFYSKLRLWDIAELALKCNQFLSKKRKIVKEQRRSSLINILPTNAVLGLVSYKNDNKYSHFKKYLKNCKHMIEEE